MSERQFPIIGQSRLPSVPWSVVEPYEQRALSAHHQSLEQLARRGGLSIRELATHIEGRSLRDMPAQEEAERIVDAAVRARPDAAILRRLLWLRHGCAHAALYGDDGEMQCANCRIDFKRDATERIEEVFHRQAVEATKGIDIPEIMARLTAPPGPVK